MLKLLGHGACHQKLNLSFNYINIYMPVCSRCTGIYIGFLFSFVALMAIERKIQAGSPPKNLVITIAILFSLMSAESLLSFLHLIPALNFLRFATGLLVGWFIPPLLTGLMNSVALNKSFLRNGHYQNGHYLSKKKSLAIWIILLFPVVALFYFTFERAIYFWSIFSVAGLIVFIAFMIFIIIIASSRRPGNPIDNPKKFILFFIASIVISTAFILLSSFLKTLTSPYIHLLGTKFFPVS